METSLIAVISVVSLVVATLSMRAALAQAQGVDLANEAAIFLAFSDRYNSEAMRDALRFLVKLHEDHGANIPQYASQVFNEDGETSSQINNARRVVSRFYFDVARLYQAHLITRRLAKALLANNGLNVFYKVCEPINDARDPERIRSYTRILERIAKKYNRGTVRERVKKSPAR